MNGSCNLITPSGNSNAADPTKPNMEPQNQTDSPVVDAGAATSANSSKPPGDAIKPTEPAKSEAQTPQPKPVPVVPKPEEPAKPPKPHSNDTKPVNTTKPDSEAPMIPPTKPSKPADLPDGAKPDAGQSVQYNTVLVPKQSSTTMSRPIRIQKETIHKNLL